MIKNRTLEFKQKYSSLDSKQDSTYQRSCPSNFLQNKFKSTQLTQFTSTDLKKQKSLKKIAKVQSSTFLKTKNKLNSFCLHPETQSQKFFSNQNIVSRLLKNKGINTYENQNKTQTGFKRTLESWKKCKQQTSNNQTIYIKQIPNAEDFFNNLTPRSLFFCCKCFRYVFAIQKKLHHPKCQTQINLFNTKPKQLEKIGWQKLKIIFELSQYTKFKLKEITKLYDKFKNKRSLDEKKKIVISPHLNYLSFEQIEKAFTLICEILFINNNKASSQIFNLKKLLFCTEQNSVSTIQNHDLFG